MIHVEGLIKQFTGLTAVDGVTFDIPRGEVVGFLGPNGAGKSTTMRILTGYIPPTSGSVRIADIDVLSRSLEARRHLGYLPEQIPLYRDMRVAEYLDFRLRLKGRLPRPDRRRRLGEVLARCGLTERRRSLIGQLSKGFRQRVGIADAIVNDPPVLILDEPTVGLDVSQIQEIRRLIRELGEDHTVLLSTHILQEVEMVCSRVLILHRGKLVRDGRLEEFQREGEPGLEELFLRIVGEVVRGDSDEEAA